MQQLFEPFMEGLRATTAIEFIAVVAGIVSVIFSRKENILVYPTGLINTTLFIYLSLKGALYGEASVNFYYTIMSIYGWWNWSRKDNTKQAVVHITAGNLKAWLYQLLFFAVCFGIIYAVLSWVRNAFAPDAIPWADALASAAAFTGMWLMAKKKLESWYWWIVTNIVSIPLWFVKGYVFTSVQFMVLLGLAVAGLVSWKRKL